MPYIGRIAKYNGEIDLIFILTDSFRFFHDTFINLVFILILTIITKYGNEEINMSIIFTIFNSFQLCFNLIAKDYWDTMDSQEMPKELMERMKIIVQAETHGKSQLTLLDNKIRDLKVRIKRCSKSGNKAYKYTLEHRKRVAQNVRAVYQRYVMKKKVEAARLLIRDFMRQTLPAVRNRVIGQETASSSEETDRE